jgi:myosin-crossreactive antigen
MNKLAVERDRLREHYDLRRIPKKQLTRYQQTQLKDIEKQIADLTSKEIQKKIFNTFD